VKIKIGRSDKRGVNGWIKGGTLYLEGSDHRADGEDEAGPHLRYVREVSR
jgi:hypothetical protein